MMDGMLYVCVGRAIVDGMLRNYLVELDSILDIRLNDNTWFAKRELLTALKTHVARLRNKKLLTEAMVKQVDEAVKLEVRGFTKALLLVPDA
jgi:hypothetical protein